MESPVKGQKEGTFAWTAKSIRYTKPSVKPKCNTRNIMKSSTRDEAEGRLHRVKGKIKEVAGKVSMNPDLEAEGKDELLTGKTQEKIGQVTKVVEKYCGVSCTKGGKQ
jgi:uncharacterized protein YjbJ (UPF0337 family)